MHQLSTPETRFAALVAADGSRPFVTYYDEATGERTELSRKSLANWVAKTRNLLGDELGLAVGDTALVSAPAHWITVPIVLGCLCAGVELTDSGPADVAFTGPDADAGGALDHYVVNPERAAVGFGAEAPGGASDYVHAVRPQADAWAGVVLPATVDDPGLPGLTRGEALDRAIDRAAELGLGEGGRLLVTAELTGVDFWIDAILAPVVVGGSLVIVRNGDAVLERRAEQERVTVRRR